MPKIEIKTAINAEIQLVFDLSRSTELHEISTKKTNEKAISGKTSGLFELNDKVTWRGKHFGIYQTLSVKITEFESPTFFKDEMTKGIFANFNHSHYFEKTDYGTLMTDCFEYKSPLGFLGRIADFLFLKKYMTNFLLKRNQVIKEFAETEKCKQIFDLPKD